VVGYATVKTHARPPGSEGVNYKVFLDQASPIGGTHLPNEPITASHSSYSHHYKPTTSYYTDTSYAPPSYPSASYTSTRRSRASTRSASLPRHYTPSTPSRGYVAPTSATLRMMATDGPAPALPTWTPWKSARPAASRQRDEDEFYRRLRDIRLRATSPVSDDLDLSPRRSSRGRTAAAVVTRPALAYSPNVIYTGKKIDTGLIPDRPVPPPLPPIVSPHSSASFLDDNPSRYHEFEPTDVGVVVLPNGQRAVTYTRQSQTGHGDHQQANVEIEKIIKKTKHLQDSMHTLEEFVRRNRSLFPDDIIIYQNVKFFRFVAHLFSLG